MSPRSYLACLERSCPATACATRPRPLHVTGKECCQISCQYRMWSDLIPVRELAGLNSYRYDSYRYGILYRSPCKRIQSYSGHQEELVPLSCKDSLRVCTFYMFIHRKSLVLFQGSVYSFQFENFHSSLTLISQFIFFRLKSFAHLLKARLGQIQNKYNPNSNP